MLPKEIRLQIRGTGPGGCERKRARESGESAAASSSGRCSCVLARLGLRRLHLQLCLRFCLNLRLRLRFSLRRIHLYLCCPNAASAFSVARAIRAALERTANEVERGVASVLRAHRGADAAKANARASARASVRRLATTGSLWRTSHPRGS